MMKFGQWGDSPTKEDGSFSFGPVNVVNSAAHTTPSTLIKQGETQLPRHAVAEDFFFWVGEGWGDGGFGGGGIGGKRSTSWGRKRKARRLRESLCFK